MNAEQFFDRHSIEEISKKTKISPISLRFIRNKEFEKIPKAKFFGFINIIEKEFNVDLSELKEEYNHSAPKKEEKHEIITETKDKKNYLLFILALLLLIIGGFILYTTLNKNPSSNTDTKFSDIPTFEQNNSSKTANTENLENNSTNITQNITTAQNKLNDLEQNSTKKINTANKSDKKTFTNITKTAKKYSIDIIPQKLVWFRAVNIDTNKTKEYLTSKEKILPKGNYYIKFGHGEITINYGNQTITPNTKKIIRILFKDGNYTYMKKPNRFEK